MKAQQGTRGWKESEGRWALGMVTEDEDIYVLGTTVHEKTHPGQWLVSESWGPSPPLVQLTCLRRHPPPHSSALLPLPRPPSGHPSSLVYTQAALPTRVAPSGHCVILSLCQLCVCLLQAETPVLGPAHLVQLVQGTGDLNERPLPRGPACTQQVW